MPASPLPLLLLLCFAVLGCSQSASTVVGPPSGPDTEITLPVGTGDPAALPQIITLGEDYTDELIQLYNEDGTPWHAFSYKYDDSDGEYEYYNPAFAPLAFHPDYYVLAMLSLNENDEFYFVEVDAAGTLKKVPKTAAVRAISLADYFGEQRTVAVYNTLPVQGDNKVASQVPPGTYDVLHTRENLAILRSTDSGSEGDTVRVFIYDNGAVNLHPLLD